MIEYSSDLVNFLNTSGPWQRIFLYKAVFIPTELALKYCQEIT